MGYFEGFGVTVRQHRLFGGKRVTAPYSGGRVARKVVSRRRGKRKGTESESTAPAESLASPDLADDVKAAKPSRLHGRHVLGRYEDGMEKCIGCELCAGICPAQCIYVRGADNDPENPTSPGERYGFVYEINYLRCIHCDLCVEACPTEAITESKLFEFSFTNRDDAIYTKTELLVGDDGRPQRLPWEDWREGEDADTSGWVRATAPSGDADFIGVVGWSAELGYGVRPPEPPQDEADGRDTQCDGGRVIAARRLRHRLADGARRRRRRRRAPAPGALRAEPGADAVRDRRALRRPGGPLPGRGAGHRLRRGDRRPVPVRDHAARRRHSPRICGSSRCRSSARWRW